MDPPFHTYEELAHLNKDLTDKLKGQADLHKILLVQLKLANALNDADELNKGLSLCLDAAIEASGLDCGWVYLFDEAAAELKLVVHNGLSGGIVCNVSTCRPDSENTKLIMKGEPFYIDFQQWEEPFDPIAKNEYLHAVGVLPIRFKDKVIGCMNMGSHTLESIPDASRISLEMIALQLEGAISRILEFFRDITEKKEAEKKLKEVQERYAALFDRSFDCVYVHDLEGNYIDANQAVMEMTGYTKEEVVKLNFGDLIDQDQLAQAIESVDTIIRQGSEEQLRSYKIRTRNNEFREIESRGALIYRDGKPYAIQGVARDITDQKKVEKALIESESKLEKRAAQLARLSSWLTLAEQRERDRIAEILHDHLQQLIVGAKIGQETLICKIDDSLEPSAKRVLDLINQSLRLSRDLSAELSPSVLKSGNFSASLEWLARWVFENYGLEVKLQIKDEIVLDRQDIIILLFKSIRELLLNALKHAGVKSASVTAGRKDGELRIVISDRGVGFNPESMWEKKGSDHHFGLFSIHERLLHLGGHLEIKSSPNAGSVISMCIPLDDKKSTEKKLRILSNKIKKKLASALSGTDRIRVLLVDDHPVLREGLSKMLSFHSDIEIVGDAPDGEKAVHMARELVPDVILMDINMPKMNGLEATRIIHSEFPHIRIIGLSMYKEDEQAAAMIDAGASAYRSKSDNMDLLLATIRKK